MVSTPFQQPIFGSEWQRIENGGGYYCKNNCLGPGIKKSDKSTKIIAFGQVLINAETV